MSPEPRVPIRSFGTAVGTLRERHGAWIGGVIADLDERHGPAIVQALRVPRLATDAVRAAAAGDAPGARRRMAVLAGWAARGPDPGRARGAGLVRDALDAALVGSDVPVRILGRRARALAGTLEGRFSQRCVGGRPGAARPGDVVVLSGALEAGSARDAGELLRALADRPALVVAHLPLWPESRHALPDEPIKVLRGRPWWIARFAEHGWEPALELRRSEDGLACLVFRRPRSAARAAHRRTPSGGPRIRVNDDLSSGGSFAWISSSIALALHDLGVAVSIAPTRLAASIEPAMRTRLEPLVERDAPEPADSEIGWTHFWHRYRRPLGGRLPLALFAINYQFARRRLEDHDAWMRGLIEGDTPLAPISTFCRDVLADAGVAPERLHVVPMAYTQGIENHEPGTLPAARTLRLLHVTNAADAERNGTPLALDAYAEAFAPGDDVTFVVRDYGGRSEALETRIASMRDRGYDVRYWPVFLAPDRLGALIGAFDALVAPFRGEGFGIKLLDAMACGVPVVGPLYGGPRDFMDADVAFPVAYDLVPVRVGYDAERLRLGNEPQWAGCRHEDLVRVLRDVAGDPALVRSRGEAARDRVLTGFTWRHTAQRVVDLVSGRAG